MKERKQERRKVKIISFSMEKEEETTETETETENYDGFLTGDEEALSQETTPDEENPSKRLKLDTDVLGILVDMRGNQTHLSEKDMKNVTTHLKCEYYETIGLHEHDDLDLMAYIDEEGKMNAEINCHATAFARKSIFYAEDSLHGNVIFANLNSDDEGVQFPLTQEQIKAVTELKPTQAEYSEMGNLGLF